MPDTEPVGPVSTWQRSPTHLYRRLVDGVMVLAVDGEHPVALHDTAAALWDLLDAPITVAALTAALADRYHADVDVVGADVTGALHGLAANHLVVTTPSTDHEPAP